MVATSRSSTRRIAWSRGEHAVAGRRVDLSRITCPLLTVTTTADAICPPAAALGLEKHVGSADRQRLSIPGGHVGGVVGEKAKTMLYPKLADFLRQRTALFGSNEIKRLLVLGKYAPAAGAAH